MQGQLVAKCWGCGRVLGTVDWDTADLLDTAWSEHIERLRRLLLDHRDRCPFYGKGSRVDSGTRKKPLPAPIPPCQQCDVG